jgi:hypothetical protein
VAAGDDVAHRAHAWAFDLGGEDAAGGAEFLAAVQMLVFEAGRLAPHEAEQAPDRDMLRVLLLAYPGGLVGSGRGDVRCGATSPRPSSGH